MPVNLEMEPNSIKGWGKVWQWGNGHHPHIKLILKKNEVSKDLKSLRKDLPFPLPFFLKNLKAIVSNRYQDFFLKKKDKRQENQY